MAPLGVRIEGRNHDLDQAAIVGRQLQKPIHVLLTVAQMSSAAQATGSRCEIEALYDYTGFHILHTVPAVTIHIKTSSIVPHRKNAEAHSGCNHRWLRWCLQYLMKVARADLLKLM